MEIPWQLLALAFDALDWDMDGNEPHDKQISFRKGEEVSFHAVTDDETLAIEFVLNDVQRSVELGIISDEELPTKLRDELAKLLFEITGEENDE